MTTSTTSLTPTHTDSASFRAWGKAISDQLTAVGLTQTTDTGQVNWATVAYAATTNNNLGYEVWRFNDTLQSTLPIFLRIDYGTGAVATRPRIMLTVGSGSDGSGAITGVTYSSFQVDRASTPTGGPWPVAACYSATDGFLGFAAFPGSTGANLPGFSVVVIARSCNDAGAPTADGYAVYSVANTTRIDQRVYSAGTGTAASNTQHYVLIPGGGTSSAVGADVQIFRHYAAYPSILPHPQVLTYMNSEIAEGGTFSLTIDGVTRTYRAMGAGMGYASVANQSAHCLAMLWQ